MSFVLLLIVLLVCSIGAGYLVARHPLLPEYMTPEADRPVRERVTRLRRKLART